MMHRAERRGELQDVAVAQHVPRISHLLFADDTLIFSQASEEALGCIKRILEQLEQAFRLKINLDKLAMVFSRNVPQAHHTSFATILGVQVVASHAKYLGLLTTMGRSKREVF
ncbi:UNVERIFIED_CONTAM: hypothetical protein Slati_3696000 [Sesamum latifolium]|uniref:Reverse transcriptase domain-containing protein n=1 Tax=Sesamum latifolium TaxID=2727402 RepID=A0AAW2U3D8_9LAMI